MIFPLKYSTASQEVPLGFFLDTSTGNVEQTGLTINNTDIKLWKSGATTLANKNSGGATHISNGIYYCTLDATDTNTYGPLEIFIHVSGALAFHKVCTVINTNVYDALMTTSTGSILSHVTALADNVITDASIASDAEYTLEQIGGAVWDIQRSAHTSTGSFGEYVNINTSSGITAADVWAYGTRTITGGTVATVSNPVTVGTNNDKTGYTASTVSDKTGYSLAVTPPTAQNIWEYATRTITSAGIVDANVVSMEAGVLTSTAIADELFYTSTEVAQETWSYTTRTLTSSGAVVVATNNDKTGYTVSTNQDKTGYSLSVTPPTAQNIWEYGTRTLTSSGATPIDYTQVADAVWDAQRSAHTSTGTFGEYVNVQSSSGSISAAFIAGAVWDAQRASYANSGSFGQGVSSVQGNVTGSAASVSGSVGSVSAAVTVGTNNDKTGYSLSVAPPTTAQIWSNATRTLTSSGAVTVAVNNDKTGYTVSTVQDKTGYSLSGGVTVTTNNDKTGYTVSTVQDKTGYSLSVTPPTAAEIWNNTTRTLTSSGTTPIDPADIWTYANRTLTSTGAITSSGLAQSALDVIANAVWDEQRAGHTTSGSFGEGVAVAGAITLGDIVDGIWDEQLSLHTSTGSAGKQLADTVTSAGTVYINIGEEEIASAVWGADRATYTSTGTFGEYVNVNTEAIWESPTRTLTSSGTTPIDASDVWNYHTRTLTSTGAAEATLANQEIIINHLEDIKGTGWTDESLVSIQEGVNNGIWGGYGI